MATTDRKGQAAGLAGLGLTLSSPYTGDAINAAYRARTRALTRRLGTTGALDEQRRPVPLRGEGAPPRQASRRAGQQGRAKSPRVQAIERYTTERAKLAARKPPIHGRRAVALGVGQFAAGAGLSGYSVHRAHQRASEVGKAADFFTDPALSPVNWVGIPPWRTNPVDPLAMKASSSIMAGILVGATGKRLSRRERRYVERNANRFVGAQHLVVTPTGMRGLVTA